MFAGHIVRTGRQFAIGRAAQDGFFAIHRNQIVPVRQAAGKLPDRLRGIESHSLRSKVIRQSIPVRRDRIGSGKQRGALACVRVLLQLMHLATIQANAIVTIIQWLAAPSF